MNRYMVHLTNKGYGPKDARSLLKRANDLCKDLKVTIRDVRISKKFIQYDI